jgi:hypothetical protein
MKGYPIDLPLQTTLLRKRFNRPAAFRAVLPE